MSKSTFVEKLSLIFEILRASENTPGTGYF